MCSTWMYLTHTASQQVFFMFSGGALAEGFQARMFEFQNFERRFEVRSCLFFVVVDQHHHGDPHHTHPESLDGGYISTVFPSVTYRIYK